MILISVIIGCAIFGVAFLIGVYVGKSSVQQTKRTK